MVLAFGRSEKLDLQSWLFLSKLNHLEWWKQACLKWMLCLSSDAAPDACGICSEPKAAGKNQACKKHTHVAFLVHLVLSNASAAYAVREKASSKTIDMSFRHKMQPPMHQHKSIYKQKIPMCSQSWTKFCQMLILSLKSDQIRARN